MTDCRDWSKTLWNSSFKGAPFYVESSRERGGRRIDVHEFPMRDDPFNEDLGSKGRTYPVRAYLTGDTADIAAAALVAALDSRGPGLLVTPDIGPVEARCDDFDREFKRDELGRIAIDLVFVKEGAKTALVSSARYADLAFRAAETLAAAAISSAVAAIRTKAQPDFVVAAARNGFADALGALEAVRVGSAVAVEASAAARTEIDILAAALPGLVSPQNVLPGSVPERVVVIAQALGDGLAPSAAVQAFGQLVDLAPPFFPARRSVNSLTADVNTATAERLLRLAALTAYAEALIRADYPSRREAIAARAAAAERFEAEMGRCNGADDAALYLALGALRGRLVEYLSRVVIDAAPVLTIDAVATMPAIWWAYRLYQDPARAGELVARNGVKHPQFMPQQFEALAS